jgi:hypothetical protein
MELSFLKKFWKGVDLPSFSISLEDSTGVFVFKEKRKIKSYLIEGFKDEIVMLSNGDWKINFEEGRFEEILKKLKSQNFKIDKAVLLIPDFLSNVFILSFESLPKNEIEIERLIRWRVERLFPLKEEFILRYNIFRKNKEIKVLVVTIYKSVLQQFILWMDKFGIKTPFISIPILTLYNFIKKFSSSKNGIMLINRLSRGTTFFGFDQSSVFIFRSKIGALTKKEVIDEAISTIGWLQEKEGLKTEEVWIRDISEEKWDGLEKPFLSISSSINIKDVKFLAPHLGIPEWTE